MEEHTCKERQSCSCSIQGLEPDEECPIHGGGPWPPRCHTCGKFMKREIRKASPLRLGLTDKERYALESFLEGHGNCTKAGLVFEVSHGSGIGPATTVICDCGLRADLTDYSAW